MITHLLRRTAAATALGISMSVLGLAGAPGAKAQSTDVPPSGVLRCDISGGVGFIFGSTRKLACTYSSTQGRSEFYSGRINKFGIDVGFLRSGIILWSVLAPGVNTVAGALEGRYGGISAQIAAGRGIGANALIANNKIMLNPLSIEGLRGINVAFAISGLKLEYVSQPVIERPLPLPPG